MPLVLIWTPQRRSVEFARRERTRTRRGRLNANLAHGVPGRVDRRQRTSMNAAVRFNSLEWFSLLWWARGGFRLAKRAAHCHITFTLWPLLGPPTRAALKVLPENSQAFLLYSGSPCDKSLFILWKWWVECSQCSLVRRKLPVRLRYGQ